MSRVAAFFRGSAPAASSSSSAVTATAAAAAADADADAARARRLSGNLGAVRERRGIILFTHIRRAGGTVLEDYVLKPYVKATQRQAHQWRPASRARA